MHLGKGRAATTSRRQNWLVIESKHEIPALVRRIIVSVSSELILNGSDTNQRRVDGLELRRRTNRSQTAIIPI